MLNEKVVIHLIVVLINWICFPIYWWYKIDIKVKLDLSSYVAKSNIKEATGVDTSEFVKTRYFS